MPELERIGVRYSITFLLRVCGCLWLYPVELCPKWRVLLGTRRSLCTPGIEEPLGHEESSAQNGQMAKSCLLMVVGKSPVCLAPKSCSF
jgi:hypothetical protein